MTFDEIAAPKAVPCVRCGKPSEVEVWGHRICYPCQGVWYSDDRFSSGVINKALRISDRIEDFTNANHERYCVEAKRRTTEWLKERS